MTKARAQLISLEATPYYHCVSRCVRRSFLCGYDSQQNRCFEHRRGWIEERLLKLAHVFCIDVCAYSIMSNHYHVVLHVNQEDAQSLSDQDICERWLSFHTPPLLIQKWLKQDALSEAELLKIHDIIGTWRERLSSISWFMRLLNQYIATQANKEDGCTGHFWEGRFKSQALLDESALAAAMAYVDLNPVRSNIAGSPETSEYTSVKARIDVLKENNISSPCLYPFVGNPRKDMPQGIPFRLMDYLELVDWTGRQIRDDKRGNIANTLPPILNRLGISQETWLNACTQLERGNVIGKEHSIKHALPVLKRKRVSGFRLPDS
ncbi:transposase [Vibrio penaeicida]|uniref:Transposase n=1 Tax=Vibrio penaeicida TaxID=104609 RepID=A0AAV5NTM0_9VIBR|nr:transposase [Vibrio penaeicida]RTZ19529.1 transposase [Vibrio penaeicida]GLQ73899.1 transposase [Vibrio penaeicida]